MGCFLYYFTNLHNTSVRKELVLLLSRALLSEIASAGVQFQDKSVGFQVPVFISLNHAASLKGLVLFLRAS